MADVVIDAYRYVPPAASSFTHTYATNSISPTKTDTSGRGLVNDFGITPAAGDNVRAFTKNKASSPTTYDLILRQHLTSPLYSFMGGGLCVSDGTKFVTFVLAGVNASTGPVGVKVTRWTNNTTFSSDRLAAPTPITAECQWLKIGVVSGDPSLFSVSANGTDWVQLLSESQTGFLTYTEVGMAMLVNRSAGQFPVTGTNHMSQSVLYFSDPDIVPGL